MMNASQKRNIKTKNIEIHIIIIIVHIFTLYIHAYSLTHTDVYKKKSKKYIITVKEIVRMRFAERKEFNKRFIHDVMALYPVEPIYLPVISKNTKH